MTDMTTIGVTREQKDELESRKRHENEAYHAVVARLLSGESDAETPEMTEDALREMLAESGGSLTYDDVKEACAAAIRDELPVERMGGR